MSEYGAGNPSRNVSGSADGTIPTCGARPEIEMRPLFRPSDWQAGGGAQSGRVSLTSAATQPMQPQVVRS